MGYNPHFCLATFGSPNLIVAKASSGDKKKKWDKWSQWPFLGDKGATATEYLKTHSWVPIQRSNSYKCFLPATLNLEERGHGKCYLPFSIRCCRYIPGRADFGRSSNSLLASASFPQICLQALEWVGYPAVLIVVARNYRKGKINVPQPFMLSASLRPLRKR